jgi:hypothetical protein
VRQGHDLQLTRQGRGYRRSPIVYLW